ncbi:MAG: HAMP domain-containing histidine kinase [Reyranella sp.]|uniref:sensor histidine kinase n=1 Tax=Reyranella sp. TaxID=1929291 RepID=UPI001206B20A|nr:HAMP domain-containing sensor histidine kinase [Reyranella sp.]TAJ96756.1 MAG: HAMP domain-containing histidine kinase [Reyranella sp.]TBR22980.1 MAG: HAMP domain-containing histidine kinase [Reyranella sp.]
MQRLYLQFYATILVVLAVFVGAAVLLWRVADDDNRTPQYLDVAAELTGALLPDATAPRTDQQRAIEGLQRKLRFDIALYEPDGDMIAMAGKPPPRFEPMRARTGWRRGPGGPNFVLQLPDGRWLVARQVRERPNPIFWIAAALGLVAVAVAIASFPVVRGLGRRLERLKAGVDRLGGGDLSARVKVEGRDELAALAASFNRSAERIEELVAAHRLLLANASHELRTPLTRISVAASLLGDAADPKTRESLKRDVAELDQLIEQILLASRLEALPTLERREPVDLLALAAEEASHYDVEVDGEPVTVSGDRTLLRRLVRNLVENAQRYGGGTPIEVSVKRDSDCAVLEVTDRGPGVPEAERQRIFEPFYRMAGAAESGRGSGLGLALVLDIARRHSGDAVCLAAEGGGSCFRVDLPAT